MNIRLVLLFLRELIAAAAQLSQWRGTAQGLQRFLETATGIEGFELDEEGLVHLTRRNRNLVRANNLRRGMTPEDEKPPLDHWKRRFPDLEKKLLDEYYKFKGWNQDCIPTLKTLHELDLEIPKGDFIAIMGPSGSGKTTLLNLLGGLDKPTEGVVTLLGHKVFSIAAGTRDRLRNEALGFVYQFHHLLPEFSALENVAMPLLVRRRPAAEAARAARDLLERVGLGERLEHRPAQLSGGERQRAAVARALITRPALVLADEPTGNLDRRIGKQVFDVMLELKRELGTSLVVVTHDELIAARMERVLSLVDGRLSAEPVQA